MATPFASSSFSLSLSFSSSSSSSKSHLYLLPLRTTTTTATLPSKKSNFFHNPLQKNSTLRRPILLLPAAVTEDVVSSAETAVEATKSLYKTGDEGVATVVSALFFFAFIGLSAITVGVVYLVVTDFLQKREKEKFEKDEASKKGKKKKKVARARAAGPRGFGQKVVEDEDLVD